MLKFHPKLIQYAKYVRALHRIENAKARSYRALGHGERIYKLDEWIAASYPLANKGSLNMGHYAFYPQPNPDTSIRGQVRRAVQQRLHWCEHMYRKDIGPQAYDYEDEIAVDHLAEVSSLFKFRRGWRITGEYLGVWLEGDKVCRAVEVGYGNARIGREEGEKAWESFMRWFEARKEERYEIVHRGLMERYM